MIDISSAAAKPILVWDILIRLFHWSLAIFFLLAYAVGGDRLALHAHAGYTIGGLLLFRLFWGFAGTAFARFRQFVVGPVDALRYFINLLRGKTGRYLGHNPAGAAMILALLGSITVTVLSGIALFALEGSGPLANTPVARWPGKPIENIHELAADLSLVLVVLHVLGVLLSSYIEKENLIKAMISGYKRDEH